MTISTNDLDPAYPCMRRAAMNKYKLVVLGSTTCNEVRSGSVTQLQVVKQFSMVSCMLDYRLE